MSGEIRPGDKVRIIGDCVCHEINEGTEVIAQSVDSYGTVYVYYNGRPRAIHHTDYVKVSDTFDLIANLSAEVARLKNEIRSIKNTPIELTVKVGDNTPYKYTLMAGGGK